LPVKGNTIGSKLFFENRSFGGKEMQFKFLKLKVHSVVPVLKD